MPIAWQYKSLHVLKNVNLVDVVPSGFLLEIVDSKRKRELFQVDFAEHLSNSKRIAKTGSESVEYIVEISNNIMSRPLSPVGPAPYLFLLITFGLFPLLAYPELQNLTIGQNNMIEAMRYQVEGLVAATGYSLAFGFKALVVIHSFEAIVGWWIMAAHLKSISFKAYLFWGINLFLTGIPTLSYLFKLMKVTEESKSNVEKVNKTK